MRTFIRLVMCLLCSGLVNSSARAAETEPAAVPLFLHYHGQLTDGGGTSLSGPVALQLRITDANHTALYAEDQTVTAFAGAVSAVIGNGTEVNTGAVQGGVPLDVFTPGESRLLEVWIDGALHGDPTEIVSVPYAMWSQTALRVAPGGIGTDQLAPDFLDAFAPQLVASPAYQSALADVQSAATIGVNSTFAYSASTTLQGVLEDFDNAIKAREVKNVDRAGDTMTGKLVIEKGGLEVVGDVAVTGMVDGVDISTRDTALQSHIDAPIAHGADGDIVGANTFNAHLTATTAHGADGAVVGVNTLNATETEFAGKIMVINNTTANLQSQISTNNNTLTESIKNLNTDFGNHKTEAAPHGAAGGVVGWTALNTELNKKLNATGGILGGDLDANGYRLVNLSITTAPSKEGDVATKKYVDDKIAGIPPPPSPAASPTLNDLLLMTSGVVESGSTVGIDMPGGKPAAQCHATYGYAGLSIAQGYEFIMAKGSINTTTNQLELSCRACSNTTCATTGNMGTPCRMSYLILCAK